MYLLKHNNFEFKNILSNGFEVSHNQSTIVTRKTMGDGSERLNYRLMKKTIIKVKFGRLSKEMYHEYISHFMQPEDDFTYYYDGQYYTKRFLINRGSDNLNYATDIEEEHEEFEIELEQIREVSE